LTFLPHTLNRFLATWVSRLLLAVLLGGVIGLERQLKRRPAGLRTNIFICFGAAMFTLLSEQLAGEVISERTRIAAQIITGIGFIGAGSILREKAGVTGLTTAATIFVVAAVGMACGAGFYVEAIFAATAILLILLVLGWLETWFNLRPVPMNYTITTGKTSEEIVNEVNSIVEDTDVTLHGMRLSKIGDKAKVVFSVDATHSEHQQLAERFRKSADLSDFHCTPGPERE
jgi:putative Mg2+ transporter-C (MgtC) family protein